MTGAVVAAFLAFASQVSGWAAFTTVTGDADPTIVGWALGYDAQTPRDGMTVLPFRRDVTVFKNPIIPAAGKPRTYWDTGCGTSILTLNQYYSSAAAYRAQYVKTTAAQKSTLYYQTPARALIDWKEMTRSMAVSNRLPKATPGGYISILVHQITLDGTGPYRCRIGPDGAPNSWGPWIHAEGGPNFPSPQSVLQDHMLRVAIPVDQRCMGEYGSTKNVCMLRCENSVPNGPFGGCIPFIVERDAEPEAKPEA